MRKISIITVVKNGMPLLREAIKSFDNQKYDNKEHIIIYSSSSDDTEKYLHSKKSNNRFIIKDANTGNKFDSINLGFKKSTGVVIGLLHADDIFYNHNILSNVMKNFEKDINFLYGNIRIISNNHLIRNWIAGDFNIKNVKFGWMPPHISVFMTKKFYEAVGEYSNEFKISSDYDFMIRCMLHDDLKAHYLNIYLMNMMYGGHSTRLSNLISKMKEDIYILKKNKINFRYFVLLLKNLQKIKQFFI
jgi:glycosyltransferase